MAYVFLLLAIAAEVVATSLLKSSEGFTRLWPTLGVLLGYGVAFVLLSQAVKSVPIGVAYAMWSGIGTAAIVAIAALFLGEPSACRRSPASPWSSPASSCSTSAVRIDPSARPPAGPPGS